MEAVRTADGVILATPIYQGAYSGLLKTLLDLLPKYALAGKVVLPLATAGSDVHRLALDDALRPALGVLGADRVLASRVPLNQAPRDDNARGDDASHAGRLADLEVLDAAAAASPMHFVTGLAGDSARPRWPCSRSTVGPSPSLAVPGWAGGWSWPG